MKNIRIAKVGDINSRFPYLEVFIKERDEPIIEIGISEAEELCFRIYESQNNTLLSMADWENILATAKAFLPAALKDEADLDLFDAGEE